MNSNFRDYIKTNKVLYALFFPVIKLRRAHFNRSNKSFDKIFSNIEGGSLTLTVKNIPGIYEIDSRSHILRRILIEKEYEPIIVDLIKKYTLPYKDAINIGANIGLFTNLLAKLLDSDKKVLSIEPTPNAFKYLKSNIELNKNEDKTIVYNGIASDCSGIFEINVIQGKEEYSSIAEISHPKVEGQKYIKIEVSGETIDNLVEKYKLNPGIIVIDVEGAEFQVLSGAINTLQNYKPIIISELDDYLLAKLNSNSDQIIKLLENMGYNVKNVENTKFMIPFEGNIIATPKR